MAGPQPTHPSAVSGVFGEPFAEQVAFFRRKLGNLVPTRRWDDLQGAAHDQAFMVAGAMEADLLSDLASAVDKAIAEGRGIEDFRRDFNAIVARNGWTGWTGEGSAKGEAWRVGVIYRTNSYTSYSAGRFAHLKAGNYPFWVYRHGGSLEPRPAHLSWDGVALPPDHAFWTTHYPPSDWGCSCYAVGARTAAGVRRMGGDPDKRLPDGWKQRDPKTGAPMGIGKGWDYAPGASVADAVNALAAKVANWDYRVAKAFLEELPDAQRDQLSQSYRGLPSTAEAAASDARKVWEAAGEPTPGRTLGVLRSSHAEIVSARIGRDARLFDYSLSPQELRHIKAEHGDQAREGKRGQRAVGPADFAVLPRLIEEGAPRYIGRSREHNLPVFELTMVANGEQYVARWEVWNRRRTLALLSYFIRVGAES